MRWERWEPRSWRALPFHVRRGVLRDAKRGRAPADPAVAAAAREWATAAERSASRLLVLYPVLACVSAAVTALTRWMLPAYAVSGFLVWTLAAWLGRGQARQVLRALEAPDG